MRFEEIAFWQYINLNFLFCQFLSSWKVVASMLNWLWKLLGFSQPDQIKQLPGELYAKKQQTSQSKPKAKSPLKSLAPLRHLPTTPESTPAAELGDAEKAPYQFANLDVVSGRYLNLSTDSNVEQLNELQLPVLHNPADLANWLQISVGRLAWVVDRLEEYRRPQSVKTAHYHYRWQKKSSGEYRLIEAPKPILKSIQQQILVGILNAIPAHEAAHGFVSGRSVLSNAAEHVARQTLLSMDLDNFYGRIRFTRVVALFRTIGYSREVAIWLSRLTTSTAPSDLNTPAGSSSQIRDWTRRHLPQGAPTSPALANLVAYSLDVRLSGLAKKFGVTYTRYADDLTFSGDRSFRRSLRIFIPLVGQILRNERYLEKKSKRHVATSAMRQSVTGVVVNEKLNVSRKQFDQLKAILTNCVRTGPASQNRDNHPEFRSHLMGRIAHMSMLNPRKGAKLKAIFNQIRWD